MADFEQHEAFQQIASNTRYLQSIRDAVIKRLAYEDLGRYFRLVSGVKGKQQIGIIRNIKDVTDEVKGCSDACRSVKAPGESAFFEPKEFKMCVEFCYADFLPYLTAYDLGSGLDLPDLGKSRLLAALMTLTEDATASDFWKRVFLGDKNIETKDLLSDPTKAYVFSTIDGLISRLEMFKTNDKYKKQFVELEKNTDADPYELEKGYARGLFKEVIRKAKRAINNGFIITNKALYWNYHDEFMDPQVWELESSKRQIQQGISSLYFDRVPIYAIDDYGLWREEYFKKGDKVHMPHFVLYTNKTNLMVAMDRSEAFRTLKYTYNDDTEKFKIKARYMMDFVIPDPEGFIAAI